MKKHIGLALNLLALALFFPGILLPMFSLNTELMVDLGNSAMSADLVDKELSIMATVDELFHDDRILVAALIFVFSVCIPLLKTILVSIVYFAKSASTSQNLINFVNKIGKWSMADVFVVAIFIAVLSTNHSETTTEHEVKLAMFRMIIEFSSQTLSSVGVGFYCFVGYCLLSILGNQIMQSHNFNIK